jgi:hypothetical protein
MDEEKIQLFMEKICDLNNLGEELGIGQVLSQESCRFLLRKLFHKNDEAVNRLLQAAAVPMLTNRIQ